MENSLQELTREIREGNILPERAGEYWSEEEREELKQRFYSGEGITEISLQLHRTESAIMQQLVVQKLLKSPGTERPRSPKQPQCLCSKCQFGPNRCGRNCPYGGTYA